MISLHAWRWGAWFRICGHGLHIQLNAPMLFSERHGLRRCWRFGAVRIQRLKP